jgi:hypothetical protein
MEPQLIAMLGLVAVGYIAVFGALTYWAVSVWRHGG